MDRLNHPTEIKTLGEFRELTKDLPDTSNIIGRLITENTNHCKPTTSMVLDCGITGIRNTSNR